MPLARSTNESGDLTAELCLPDYPCFHVERWPCCCEVLANLHFQSRLVVEYFQTGRWMGRKWPERETELNHQMISRLA